ncbi:MAG: carboxylesterase [Planctomycetota bacterium]|nr:MAG: carboxylesterase [Planctomycetota bacterium]
MSDALLSCVEIEPSETARAAVIWLHGLGADGHDFEGIVPALGIPTELGVRFVFPNAPRIPVTLNGGFVMPAWYDITELDLERKHDETGIRASAAQIEALIQREKERGIPSDRILLAGFSQGGAIALFTGLRHAEPLAGVMALSTYLVCEESLEAERSQANREVSVFGAHGTEDPMVPISRGRAAKERLEKLGYAVEWHEYPIPHAVGPEEVAHIGAWLRQQLASH